MILKVIYKTDQSFVIYQNTNVQLLSINNHQSKCVQNSLLRPGVIDLSYMFIKLKKYPFKNLKELNISRSKIRVGMILNVKSLANQ
jgi:hypothetical protein